MNFSTSCFKINIVSAEAIHSEKGKTREKCKNPLYNLMIFIKKLSSKWLVERIIEFPDLPLHVRLNEQGGNERTVTVALSALLDTRQWKPVKTSMPQEEEAVSEKQD